MRWKRLPLIEVGDGERGGKHPLWFQLLLLSRIATPSPPPLLPSHHRIPSTTACRVSNLVASSLPSHPITHPPFIPTPLHPSTLLMLSFFLLNRKSRERADNLCHYETLLHIKGRESFISGCHTTPFLLFARITRDLFHSNSKTLQVDFHHQDQHGVPASSTRWYLHRPAPIQTLFKLCDLFCLVALAFSPRRE